jgi:uncharacterized alkaline shock family protein YloU
VISDLVPERVVLEYRAAEAAAAAARAVPGVAALQPGLLGLVRRLAEDTYERVTGHAVPDTAGVDAEVVDGGVHLELRIVLDVAHQACAVGAAVQRAVLDAVPPVVGIPVVAARVHVVGVRCGP